jgi:hypothetical protein
VFWCFFFFDYCLTFAFISFGTDKEVCARTRGLVWLQCQRIRFTGEGRCCVLSLLVGSCIYGQDLVHRLNIKFFNKWVVASFPGTDKYQSEPISKARFFYSSPHSHR